MINSKTFYAHNATLTETKKLNEVLKVTDKHIKTLLQVAEGINATSDVAYSDDRFVITMTKNDDVSFSMSIDRSLKLTNAKSLQETIKFGHVCGLDYEVVDLDSEKWIENQVLNIDGIDFDFSKNKEAVKILKTLDVAIADSIDDIENNRTSVMIQGCTKDKLEITLFIYSIKKVKQSKTCSESFYDESSIKGRTETLFSKFENIETSNLIKFANNINEITELTYVDSDLDDEMTGFYVANEKYSLAVGTDHYINHHKKIEQLLSDNDFDWFEANLNDSSVIEYRSHCVDISKHTIITPIVQMLSTFVISFEDDDLYIQGFTKENNHLVIIGINTYKK